MRNKLNKTAGRVAWRRAVAILACLVLLCSTYAPILPVFAEEQTYCGLEHEHTADCYVQILGDALCGLAEQEAHTHGDACYITESHTHGADCFNDVYMLDCGMKEGQETVTLTCALLEQEAHTHTNDCYVADVAQPQDEPLMMSTLGSAVMAAADSTPATLSLNMIGWGSTLPFSKGNTVSCSVGDTVEIVLGDTQANYNPLNLTYSGCELVSATNSCDAGHNHTNGYWCQNNIRHTLTVRVTAANASISGDAGWYFEYNDWSITESGSSEGPAVPEATPTPTPTPTPSISNQVRPDLPAAVTTGSVNVSALRFYNLCEGGNGVAPLAGCVFEIVGDNGYSATLTSTNSPEVMLPSNLPNGNYTITEVSVPDGYMRDTDYRRTFTVNNGKFDHNDNIGTFINHDLGVLTSSKTAEVEDYNNRIYQILLDAENHMRKYEMDPVDVMFVVDQSNSMLFPSGLTETGKTVVLDKRGYGNVNAMNALNLDKSQTYYIISDPQGTSTVWALYWNGSTWLYQDASYYAKAKHDNRQGYQDPSERAVIPNDLSYTDQANQQGSGNRANGGGLGKDMNGSGLYNYINSNGDSVRFTLYTASDPYNRLHYLEESLTNMIYELANANVQNRVTLIGFTKELKMDQGPYYLTPDNTEYLVGLVNSINTGGGTRQDIGLKQAYEAHLNDRSEGFSENPEYTHTILITDGAPVRSGSSAPPLGTADSWPTTAENGEIYGQIKGWANQVKTKSNLMTVGLGMRDVAGGHAVLSQIASGEHFCALDDAAQLVREMQELLFDNFRAKDEIQLGGTIVDEISDSFYPIAWVEKGQGEASGRTVLVSDDTRDWVLPQAGDWITVDGKLTAAGAADAAGQLSVKSDGTMYITWYDALLNDGWDGSFYVKAKEDFIGGNAIDTNKDAHITVTDGVDTTGKQNLETPTVNVRLLDMNELSSEVTVYLGDIINADSSGPYESLKYFSKNVAFGKLVSGDGEVLNKTSITADNGLTEGSFFLRYALGQTLTDGQWATLMDGHPLTIEYTYDDASSHGAVGYFTFTLEKSGDTSDYRAHVATEDCQPNGEPLTEDCDAPVETYTLKVVYTAYKLGEKGRPEENVHNGEGSPGTEVGTGDTIPTGYGSVESVNVHEVHVISGAIEITKVIGEGMEPETDTTFSFTLHRQEDTTTDNDITKTVTIPAGSTGPVTVRFEGLKRGTYTVTEAANDVYKVKEIKVLDSTNCESSPAIGESADTVTFVMGNNTAKANVIGKASADALYTSYIDPVNGVFGAAEFTNTEIVYEGEVYVKKVWNDGAEHHTGDELYVVLYLDGSPVVTEDGHHRLLLLSAENGWTGSFTVTLDSKTDTPSNHDYSVREVSETSSIYRLGWHSAVREGDGAVGYYKSALAEGEIFEISNKRYMVSYPEAGTDGVLVVENEPSVVLPETGGPGTQMFTFGGLLLTAAAGVYMCILRHKRRKGGG